MTEKVCEAGPQISGVLFYFFPPITKERMAKKKENLGQQRERLALSGVMIPAKEKEKKKQIEQRPSHDNKKQIRGRVFSMRWKYTIVLFFFLLWFDCILAQAVKR